MRAAITVAGSLLLVFAIFTSEALSKVSQSSTDEEVATADEKQPKESGRDSRSGLVNANHRAVSNNARHHESKGQEEFPDGEEQKELDEYGSDNDADNEGSSRSYGGAPAGIPPEWFILSWHLETREREKLAGIMVRLNDNLVLAHKDTCIIPQGEYCHMSKSAREAATEQIQFRPGEKINVEEGPGRKRSVGCQFIKSQRIGHDIYAYVLIDETVDYTTWRIMEELQLRTRPQPQNDPYDNDDCYLYSYSGNSLTHGLESAERHYSRLRVFLKDCLRDICNFYTKFNSRYQDYVESGKVCLRSNDAGAPILCGKEKKLSYIIIKDYVDDRKTGLCVTEFKTLRLSDSFKLLDYYVNANDTMPAMPNRQPIQTKFPFNISPFG